MKKILIAEDDALLQSIILHKFIKEGFEAHAASNGFEAEAEIRSWHPDIVLLDLIMPDEDGFGVLRVVRSESGTADTRIVVLSNLGDEETKEKVKKFGVTDYFVKADMTPEEIVAKVRALIV